MSEWLKFLQKAETKDFIQTHINSDINKLLLNPPSVITPFAKEVAAQIKARQKAKRKLDDWASNFDLVFPPPISVEQASSKQTAEYKKSILSGKHLVDLTGGMGADTLALSEQFESTTYVEKQEDLVEIFKHNCDVLDKSINIQCATAESYLDQNHRLDRSFFFYLDPARRDEEKNKVFNLEDCSPNIVELQTQLKRIGGNVLVKLSPFLDIKLTLKKIDHIKEVHVVSVKNECKEVLILIDYSIDDEPEIRTINLTEAGQSFNFKFSEENTSQATLSTVKKYILEPNASILKAGAFNQAAVHYKVEKLHAHTHLYTSETLIPNWPGRVFEVIQAKVDKNTIAEFSKNGYINVMTRNYPMSPADLKKKYKVKDGGEFFLIGFIDMSKKNNLLITKKVNPAND